jgi:hypothetical protein
MCFNPHVCQIACIEPTTSSDTVECGLHFAQEAFNESGQSTTPCHNFRCQNICNFWPKYLTNLPCQFLNQFGVLCQTFQKIEYFFVLHILSLYSEIVKNAIKILD